MSPIRIVLMLAVASSTVPGSPGSASFAASPQAQEITCDIVEGRDELESLLSFLERAEAAFLFSHRSTTEVKARIAAVEERLATLDEEEGEAAERDLPDLDSRIQKMESELAFLERAEAAFFHSHRSTTEVKRHIREAEACLRELRGGS